MNEPAIKITDKELKELLKKRVKTNIINMEDVDYGYVSRQAYNSMIALLESDETSGLSYSITEVNDHTAFNRILQAFKKVPLSKEVK